MNNKELFEPLKFNIGDGHLHVNNLLLDIVLFIQLENEICSTRRFRDCFSLKINEIVYGVVIILIILLSIYSKRNFFLILFSMTTVYN